MFNDVMAAACIAIWLLNAAILLYDIYLAFVEDQ